MLIRPLLLLALFLLWQQLCEGQSVLLHMPPGGMVTPFAYLSPPAMIQVHPGGSPVWITSRIDDPQDSRRLLPQGSEMINTELNHHHQDVQSRASVEVSAKQNQVSRGNYPAKFIVLFGAQYLYNTFKNG